MKEIKTERLILTPWTLSEDDIMGLYRYASDPQVGPNAGWKPHESPAESAEIIKNIFRPHLVWAIRERESRKIIGSIGLEDDRRRENVNSRELGYSLAKDAWGKGYMRDTISPPKKRRDWILRNSVFWRQKKTISSIRQLLNDTFLRKKQLAQHAEGKGLEPQKSSPVNSKISFRLMMGTHA